MFIVKSCDCAFHIRLKDSIVLLLFNSSTETSRVKCIVSLCDSDLCDPPSTVHIDEFPLIFLLSVGVVLRRHS